MKGKKGDSSFMDKQTSKLIKIINIFYYSEQGTTEREHWTVTVASGLADLGDCRFLLSRSENSVCSN